MTGTAHGPDDVSQSGDLSLADYRPRSELRVRWAGAPARPAFPAVDAHNHLGPTPFSEGWSARDAGALEEAMDASGIAAIVDLDGGQGDALEREIARWERLGSRVAVFAGLDYEMWASRKDFGEEEARRLAASAATGAWGLKVWKTLGLRARDGRGRLVAVDDHRLDPVWSAAGELGLPVTIHVADPIAFFRPLDRTNERWEELHEHPDWHFWPRQPAGRPEAAGFPDFDDVIAGLDAVVAAHPKTTFIGAHVGCAAEDLDRVSRDAGRARELERRPRGQDRASSAGSPTRPASSSCRWADRVLFGTDAPPDPAAWSVNFRFLETRDESFSYDPDGGPGSQGRWAITGLGLPHDVLRLVYAENARRLIFRAEE